MRIAFIDMNRLLDESAEGLAGAAELRRLYESQEKENAPLFKEAGTGDKSLSPKAYQARQQLDEKLRQQQQDRERLRVTLRRKLMGRIEALVQKIAAAEGFDLVVGRGEAIFYVKAEIDLTGRVLVALDAGPPTGS